MCEKTWCEGKHNVNRIEENEPAKLNKLLKTFYAEAKNKTARQLKTDDGWNMRELA